VDENSIDIRPDQGHNEDENVFDLNLVAAKSVKATILSNSC